MWVPQSFSHGESALTWWWQVCAYLVVASLRLHGSEESPLTNNGQSAPAFSVIAIRAIPQPPRLACESNAKATSTRDLPNGRNAPSPVYWLHGKIGFA